MQILERMLKNASTVLFGLNEECGTPELGSITDVLFLRTSFAMNQPRSPHK
jgi:hypothetical protein